MDEQNHVCFPQHVHLGGGYPPQGGPPGGCPPGVDPSVYSWFVTVDADRSGQITANELQQALTNGNWSHFNPEACRLMIGMRSMHVCHAHLKAWCSLVHAYMVYIWRKVGVISSGIDL